MGCCDSKLLVETNNPKTLFSPQEESPKKNQQLKSRKEFANIFLMKPHSQQSNHSMFKLSNDIQNVLDVFQKDFGPLKTTDLSCKSVQENKQNVLSSYFVHTQKDEQKNIELDTPDMRSIQNDNSSFSSVASKSISTRNNILLNTSLNSTFKEKKQIFYNNSNCINNIIYQKWKQSQRFPFHFGEQDCLSITEHQQQIGVYEVMMNILIFQTKNSINLISGNKIQGEIGLRVFINGIKRLFPLKKQNLSSIQNSIGIKKFIESINLHKKIRCCFTIYYLTGWIPQMINLKSVKDKAGIFDRLATNFFQQNILISFTNNNISCSRTLLLDNVNFQERIVHVLTKQKIENRFQKCKKKIKWDELVAEYELIQVNWNPSIYDISLKFQISIIGNEQSSQQYPQFLLKIPININDIEVRILIEKHTDVFEEDSEIFQFQLYDFAGKRIKNGDEPIRINKFENIDICSQVFVFEAADELSEYILLVKPIKMKNQRQFTLSFHSFTQISAKLFPQQKVIDEKQYESRFQYDNNGYGLNSPYFYRNLHYSLRVPPLSTIQIDIQAEQNHHLEICMLGDPEEKKDITQLNVEELMRGMEHSPQIKGSGSITVNTLHENYILVIVSYSRLRGKVKIKVKRIWKGSYNPKVVKPFEIYIEELFFNPNIIFQKNIDWNKMNPGPRKRYKENSVPGYQPLKNFQQYFSNPYIDKKIQKGVYQFCILSQTYIEHFNEIIKQQDSEELMLNEAPTLSMGIFQKNNNHFKIILDDAYYVPYGIGFWSKELFLESGTYRFVFPKLQKDNSEGTFKIRQIQ